MADTSNEDEKSQAKNEAGEAINQQNSEKTSHSSDILAPLSDKIPESTAQDLKSGSYTEQSLNSVVCNPEKIEFSNMQSSKTAENLEKEPPIQSFRTDENLETEPHIQSSRIAENPEKVPPTQGSNIAENPEKELTIQSSKTAENLEKEPLVKSSEAADDTNEVEKTTPRRIETSVEPTERDPQKSGTQTEKGGKPCAQITEDMEVLAKNEDTDGAHKQTVDKQNKEATEPTEMKNEEKCMKKKGKRSEAGIKKSNSSFRIIKVEDESQNSNESSNDLPSVKNDLTYENGMEITKALEYVNNENDQSESGQQNGFKKDEAHQIQRRNSRKGSRPKSEELATSSASNSGQECKMPSPALNQISEDGQDSPSVKESLEQLAEQVRRTQEIIQDIVGNTENQDNVAERFPDGIALNNKASNITAQQIDPGLENSRANPGETIDSKVKMSSEPQDTTSPDNTNNNSNKGNNCSEIITGVEMGNVQETMPDSSELPIGNDALTRKESSGQKESGREMGKDEKPTLVVDPKDQSLGSSNKKPEEVAETNVASGPDENENYSHDVDDATKAEVSQRDEFTCITVPLAENQDLPENSKELMNIESINQEKDLGSEPPGSGQVDSKLTSQVSSLEDEDIGEDANRPASDPTKNSANPAPARSDKIDNPKVSTKKEKTDDKGTRKASKSVEPKRSKLSREKVVKESPKSGTSTNDTEENHQNKIEATEDEKQCADKLIKQQPPETQPDQENMLDVKSDLSNANSEMNTESQEPEFPVVFGGEPHQFDTTFMPMSIKVETEEDPGNPSEGLIVASLIAEGQAHLTEEASEKALTELPTEGRRVTNLVDSYDEPSGLATERRMRVTNLVNSNDEPSELATGIEAPGMRKRVTGVLEASESANADDERGYQDSERRRKELFSQILEDEYPDVGETQVLKLITQARLIYQEIQWEELMRSGKEDKIAEIKKRIKANTF